MISAREDISNGTKESITEWGFDVLVLYSSGASQPTVRANGRKTSIDIDSQGLSIVNQNPYLSIPIEDLTGKPDDISKVKIPLDFFRPDPDPNNWIWFSVERASKSDKDWFVKLYLTATEQSV